MAGGVVDVSALVDGQRINRFTISALLICCLAVVIDGYDIFMPGVLAPEVARLWHASPNQVGAMFSVGMLGIILGAIGFGMLGDRFGRKRMIVVSSVLYGVLTLLSLSAGSMQDFILFRFFIGLGIGGVIPNAVALVAEFAPLRTRAGFIMLVTLGAPIGQLIPGVVAATLVPGFGWQALLVVGGVGPLLIALAAQMAMPESVKYLVLHPSRRDDLVRMVRSIDTRVAIGAETQFVIRETTAPVGVSSAPLFREGLALITPMIWLCLGTGLLGVYFTSSWLPSALVSVGATREQAASHIMIYAMGGIVGGATSSWFVHRWGMPAIVAVFLVAVPCTAAIGLAGMGEFSGVVTFAAGFCIIAIVNGLEAVMGMVYPTAIRAKGTGWGLAVGRLVSLAGPILGGIVLSLHLPLSQLFQVPAAALAIGALGSLVLAPACMRRFGGARLNDEAGIGAERVGAEWGRVK
jgi:MFS transporter, AAHS family, 4-hydroxybenzoate transporter